MNAARLADVTRLRRALFVSLAVVLVLAAAAFWPASPRQAPPRPALEPPIVFDVLNPASLPRPSHAEPAAAPETGPGSK